MSRVAIIEDHADFRRTLATVFELQPDLDLVASFETIDALEQALTADPGLPDRWDLVLMDLELPGRDGVDGLRLLKAARPTLPVIMCTVHEGSAAVRRAIQQGADGYLIKRSPLPELLRHVRQAVRGGAPVSPEVAADLLRMVRATDAPAAEPAWVVRLDGSALRSPEGSKVDLRRRRTVRRVLAALAAHRLDHPGDALTAEQCLEAGWPGERMLPDAARTRLWTTIRALRATGLEDALETVGSGYRLARTVRVERT